MQIDGEEARGGGLFTGLFFGPPAELLIACGVGLLGRELAYADDTAVDLAAEAVGVGGELMLGGGDGLNLCGPEAGGDPERGEWKDSGAQRAAKGEEGDEDKKGGGEEEKCGWVPGVGEEFAEGEAAGGGEERDAAELEWREA